MNLRSIDPNDLLFLYQESYAENRDEPGSHNAPRLDAALAHPLNRAVSGDADVAAIAAGYAAGMLRYQPFTRGNEGAALLALELFLSLNGWQIDAEQDDVLAAMRQAHGLDFDEEMLANWIRRHL